MKPRWYQEEAATKLARVALHNKNAKPVAAIPTGAGKTLIICLTIDKILSEYPKGNIVVLSHVEEILSQNHKALSDYYEDFEIGLYSAGLKSRTITKITVAGIQSIYKKADLFDVDKTFIIVDEAHLVTIKGTGMYRTFLESFKNRPIVGLTATHYRLGHGYIHEGKGAIFNTLAYDLTSMDNFNRLIDEGYLSKVISKGTYLRMNADNIKMRGGDFISDALASAFDKDEITVAAVDEIIQFGKNYKKWLIFAIDIGHAEHINAHLNKSGIPSICVHSKMTGDRKIAIDKFKSGEFRAIVNVNVLTTGFDVPDIDLIGMLRPTASPVIHSQTIGRGLRVSPGKDHCLVLDFAGNTERLGPINNVRIEPKRKGSGGDPIIKECPECGVYHPPAVRECDVCGHIFEFKTKLQVTASREKITIEKDDLRKWLQVSDTSYSIHQKKGKPSSLRVTYKCGLVSYSEWVSFEHEGYAKHKANNWVKFRLGYLPDNLASLYKKADGLKKPKRICVDISEKFPKIDDYLF